jgi:hypothetical protein
MKGEAHMEEEKKEEAKRKGRRCMRFWIGAMALVTVIYGLGDLKDAMDRYEAGRARERIEMRARIEAGMESGERFYSKELGLWITPTGGKHAKATTRRVAEAK